MHLPFWLKFDNRKRHFTGSNFEYQFISKQCDFLTNIYNENLKMLNFSLYSFSYNLKKNALAIIIKHTFYQKLMCLPH